MQKSPTMLTVRETSERTGLPTSTLRKWCKLEQIVYVSAGKKVLINYDKLLDFLNGEPVVQDQDGYNNVIHMV